jgi:hypothetical protein
MIKHKINHLLIVVFLLLVCVSGCRTMPVNNATAPQTGSKSYHPQEYGEILATDIAVDFKKGEIKYTLPEPAYVRIRAGLEGSGVFLRHILDWEWRDRGPHVETWDKKDDTGRVNFGDKMDYTFVINCKPAKKGNQGFKKAPALNISFPEARQTSAEGVPIIQGVVPLRIKLDEKDNRNLVDTKFEVAIYIDYIFLMEDEVGTNPFNYRLDATQFNEGEHVLTVNIISYDGQIGAQSVKVFVQRPK